MLSDQFPEIPEIPAEPIQATVENPIIGSLLCERMEDRLSFVSAWLAIYDPALMHA